MNPFYTLPRKKRHLILSAVILSSAILNSLLNLLNHALGLPLFLDSIFTILTAAAFGVWPGILVGLLTNCFMEVMQGLPGYLLPFASVNILSAIIAVMLARRGLFENIGGAVIAIIALALGNALAGAFVVTLVFGGMTHEPVDLIVRSIILTGQSIFTSAFLARVLINTVDKGIAVVIVYLMLNYVLPRILKKIPLDLENRSAI